MQRWLQLFLIYSSIAVILPFIAAIVRYKKLGRPLRCLAVLIFFDFLAEAISHVCFFLKINNNFLWPIFIPIEFTLLALIYKYELPRMIITKVIPYLITVFALYVLADYLTEKQGRLSALPHFVEAVFVQLLALTYYYESLKAPEVSRMNEPLFWLSTGLFIYFASDCVIFLFSNYVQSFSKHFNNHIWFVHAVFNVWLYVFYTISLCLPQPNQT